MVNYSISKLLYTLFPARCILCDKPSKRDLDLCTKCERLLSLINSSCNKCGLETTTNCSHCGHCLKHPPPFHRTVSLLSYDTHAAKLIHQLKYQDNYPVIKVLTQLMASKVRQRYTGDPLPQLIIPVPLHWKRLHKRGYNQAQLTAKQLSKLLAVPNSSNYCRRIKPTAPQQNLNRAQRRNNIKGAFRAKQLGGLNHVAIVDDVVTTGETVSELTRSLQQVQPGLRVDVWSLARTPLK